MFSTVGMPLSHVLNVGLVPPAVLNVGLVPPAVLNRGLFPGYKPLRKDRETRYREGLCTRTSGTISTRFTVG